jgi:hypothetical protein
MEAVLSAIVIACCIFALGVLTGIVWRGKSSS